MTLADHLRRRLGPDGVAMARRLAARPRHAARRVIDTPGGEQFGRVVGDTEMRFGKQQDELTRTQREIAVLMGRFDEYEDYHGSRYEEAARAIQRHLVQVEELVRSVEGIKAEMAAQLDAINAQLVLGDARLDRLASRLNDVTLVADGSAVNSDLANSARAELPSVRPPAI